MDNQNALFHFSHNEVTLFLQKYDFDILLLKRLGHLQIKIFP